MKKILSLAIALLFSIATGFCQENREGLAQYGKDSDGDHYIFYTYHGSSVYGDVFKNERNMYAVFFHFHTHPDSVPMEPDVAIFLEKGDMKYELDVHAMEYVFNGLKKVATIGLGLTKESFFKLLEADRLTSVSVETSIEEHKLEFILDKEDQSIIPYAARKLNELEFKDK